jgi:ribonuclease P protein component
MIPKRAVMLYQVPKKNFPRAVDRNKLKRLVREVIRKNAGVFCDVGKGRFMFIFSSNKIEAFLDIEKDFKDSYKKGCLIFIFVVSNYY